MTSALWLLVGLGIGLYLRPAYAPKHLARRAGLRRLAKWRPARRPCGLPNVAPRTVRTVKQAGWGWQ